MSATSKVPVTILTGFLGSGKTTLLNDLLSSPAFRDTAIIVNEFGDVPVDHDLIRIGDREMMVTTTGCLCCTAGSDIRSSLFDLHEAARVGLEKPFSRVIFETTGLADLAPVINQIVAGGAPAVGLRDHVIARMFRLAGVVCLVDAIMAAATLEHHFECLKQVAFADRIVLTKTDMAHDPASRKELRALAGSLRAINTSAQMFDRHDPEFDPAALFLPREYVPADLGLEVEGWLALESALAGDRGRGHTGKKPDRHASGGIRTAALTADEPIPTRNFDRFFMLLQMAAGAHLLRLKGIVCLEEDPERPLVVHAVQHVVHPPKRLDEWPSADRRTRIVAITHDIEPAAIRELFDAVARERQPLRRRRAVAAAAAIGLALTATALAAASWSSTAAAPPASADSDQNRFHQQDPTR